MTGRHTPLAVLGLGAALTFVSVRVWTNLNVPGAPHVRRFALQDFRDVAYYPSAALLAGDNPYDRVRYVARYPVGDTMSLYSPLVLLMHVPFALLPYRVAELVYYLLNVALTLALGALVLWLCGLPLTTASVAGLTALIVLSRPGHWNLFTGQVTLEAVLTVLLALWFADERPWLAGLALAVATFKPTYGLPLALLLLARGEWRAVLIGGVIAAAITAVPLTRVVAASGGVASFAESLERTYTVHTTDPVKQPQKASRVDVVALAARLHGRPPGNLETLALTLGVLGFAAVALRRLSRARDRDTRLHAIGVACLAIVACGYHQQYDLLALAVPAAVLAWRPDAAPWREHPALRTTALALVLVPLANYVGSETAARALALSPGALLAAGSLDNVAVLALLAIFAGLALREMPTSAAMPRAQRAAAAR